MALERAWERYHGNVGALVNEGVSSENRSKVVAMMKRHVELMEMLRDGAA